MRTSRKEKGEQASRNRLYRWGGYLLILIIVFLLVIVGVYFFERLKPTGPKQVVKSSVEEIERGRYLAAAADCASCHTAENGAPFAGGYQLNTAFGTIYSSNITPSENFGIGRWSKDDFYRSITEGVSPIHRNLYPAMPYPYYANVTQEDSDALYAYFMSLPEVNIAPPHNKLSFPFNQRALLIGWNLFFYDKTPLPTGSKGNSFLWQRGEYLVNTLGHCAMCHTPMGEFGNIDRDKMFQGNIVGRFLAPDITAKGLAARGWNKEGLQRYFSEGIAPQGSAFSDMYLVVHNSTSHLEAKDIEAITTFLLGDEPPKAKLIVESDVPVDVPGYDTYLNLCAGCHNIDGKGKPNVSVALVGNSTVMNPDSHNLIVTILDGLPWQSFPNDERFQAMPEFASEMSDSEIATLINFLRIQWGGLPGNVTEKEVSQLRR